MSGLYKPGVGDLLDRLSVLTLKILHGQEAGKLVNHFEEEAAVLMEQVNRLGGDTAVRDLLALQAVNALIWQNEDHLRALRGVITTTIESGRALNLAFRSQALNDRRAELVRKINADTKTGVQAPEKVSG